MICRPTGYCFSTLTFILCKNIIFTCGIIVIFIEQILLKSAFTGYNKKYYVLSGYSYQWIKNYDGVPCMSDRSLLQSVKRHGNLYLQDILVVKWPSGFANFIDEWSQCDFCFTNFKSFWNIWSQVSQRKKPNRLSSTWS